MQQPSKAPLRLLWNRGPSKSAPVNALALPWSKYIPIKPTPKQLAFLMLDCLEALYGGAAGGGKSIAELAAALQYVDEPGYAALILRKTYADLSLPGALMDVAHQWLNGTDARPIDGGKAWTFPSSATLTFGYLAGPQDKYRYQSAAFQFIGFDELTQFPENDYKYMFSRLRRLKGSSIPIRMRTASNPGNIGHEWVKQRFMVEQNDNRVFLPAKLADNPHLDEVEYIKSLDELDPITKLQLLNGDWSARKAGNKFKREWFEIVDAAPVDIRKVRRWDLAATEPKPGKDPDWTAGALVGRTSNNLIYIMDMKRMRGNPLDVDTFLQQTAELDGRSIPIRIEQEGGSSGKKAIDDYVRRVLFGYDVKGIPSTGSKEIRANPVAAQAGAGNVKLVRGPWINAFLDEAELFPNGTHDDQIDAVSGAFADLTGFSELSGNGEEEEKKDKYSDDLRGIRDREL